MKLYFVLSALLFLSACFMSHHREDRIFEAIYRGNKGRVIALVQRGIDIHTIDDEGTSLLMVAAWHGKRDIAEWLLEHDAEVDREDNYSKTALMYAADKGHAEIVALLLEHGADIHKVDELAQWKPLDYAVARDHEDVVKTMLKLKGNELSQKDRQRAAQLTKNVELKKLLRAHKF